MNDTFKILSPTAILGYGYPIQSLLNGFKKNPDLVAVDAGSTDPGPYYLGSGKPFTNRAGVKRDLFNIIKYCIPKKIPLIIGTAGGSGAKPHVDWSVDIVKEICKELSLSVQLGVIYSDIPKEVVKKSIASKELKPLNFAPDISAKEVDNITNVVAQMGIEPIQEAIKKECDIILCGRCYDPAVFAALPIMYGYDDGLAVHLGKILECAAIAATPGSGADCVLGTLTKDSFILEPLSKERKFTSESTAAHTLYEKSNPYFLPGPGGRLNLTECTFKELSNGRVEVKGSKFELSDDYFIKLEGAKVTGYRTISIAGTRDPIMIDQIDAIIKKVSKLISNYQKEQNIQGKVLFHVYGKDGVMGNLEPNITITSHELGIIIDVVADTEEDSETLCSITRSTLLHYGYKGRISTAGNLAFPFSPSDVHMGEVYEFSLYHLMKIKDQDLFAFKKIRIKN